MHKRSLLLGIWAVAAVGPVSFGDDAGSAQALFEKRILPIFSSPDPSSCTQCHLADLDLKAYILPSHEKTFLSLRDQGLVDLDRPAESKILKFISMREPENEGANLIHDTVRKAELEAFTAWIEASCQDPKLRVAPRLAAGDLARPDRPQEIVRHARKDRLLDSFEQNVWSMRFRCMGCHREGTEESAKHVKEHGQRVLWMKKTALETMEHLLTKPRVVNEEEPEKSLLLLKPLGEVKHGGGKKILTGDLAHKGFRAWIEDYAATVGRKYAKPSDLPQLPRELDSFGSEIWLKLEETPPAWGEKLLQVTLFRWDETTSAWEKEPIAVSDRGVWGKGKLWQHSLTLLAPKGSPRAVEWKRGKIALPQGRYRVDVQVDREDRLAKDWKAKLEAKDFAGRAEVTSKWRAGYGRMTVVNAKDVTQ